jgi:hypothetical protein
MKCLILFLTVVIFFKWFKREGLYNVNNLKSSNSLPVVSSINDQGITTESLIADYRKLNVNMMDAQIEDLSNSLAYII